MPSSSCPSLLSLMVGEENVAIPPKARKTESIQDGCITSLLPPHCHSVVDAPDMREEEDR
eukprot:8594993-Ditylum_brightwellii.AAC.1